jgi:hypothetical protein
MRTYIYSYGAVTVGVALLLYFGHVPFQPYLYLCGAVLSGLGISLLYRQLGFILRSRKGYGRLVGWTENSLAVRNSSTAKVYYYAQIVFEAPDGSEHRITSATGECPKPSTPVGHVYPVRYDPDNPDEARLDTIFDFWGPGSLIFLLGAVALCLSFHVQAR